MTLQQAARHNPEQLAFMLSGESTIMKMCNKMIARQLEIDGLPADHLYQVEMDRLRTLREKHGAPAPVRTRGNGRG